MSRCTSRIALLAAAFLVSGSLAAGEGDVLYWMVNASATEQDSGQSMSISDFFDAYVASAESWSAADSSFSARIRVTGGGISSGQDVFLSLYGLDEHGQPYFDSGEVGVAFDDGTWSGYWGAGVPDGNQSPSGDYSAGTPEYAFIVEIGHTLYDESSETMTWVETIAKTRDAYPYTYFADKYIHEAFDIFPGNTGVWAPTDFTAAPEPSSGILALLGMAIVSLRRRRR